MKQRLPADPPFTFVFEASALRHCSFLGQDSLSQFHADCRSNKWQDIDPGSQCCVSRDGAEQLAENSLDPLKYGLCSIL